MPHRANIILVMFCGLGAIESAAAAGEQQESTARTTIIYLLYCDVLVALAESCSLLIGGSI